MKIAIIGNGVAGVTAAETIRARDAKADIAVFSQEPFPFYSRPRLIEFLAGKATADQITIHARHWYDKNGIELHLSNTISALDPGNKQLIDDRGGSYRYDRLVIAVGARSSLPPIPGIDGPRVFSLRTIDDAERIKKAAAGCARAAVIGGGLLGIEVAHSLSALGMAVTVIEVFDRLLPRQIDREGSKVLRSALEAKGLSFAIGRKTQAVEERSGKANIVLDGGMVEAADFAVIAAGIRPDLSVVRGTAIEAKRGIVVDGFMRTTAPDIYACGDVAEFRGTLYGLWQPAREQAVVCGGHITGSGGPYEGSLLSARLKVAGIELASLGCIEGQDGTREITEQGGPQGSYKKLFVKNGRLAGAILIGDVKDAARLQQMIKSGTPME